MEKKGVKRTVGKVLAYSCTVVTVIVVCLSMSACNKKEATTEEKPMFAFIINCPGRFWEIAHAGCQQAAVEEGVQLEFHVPGQSSAAQQKQILEALVAKGCNGVTISAHRFRRSSNCCRYNSPIFLVRL